MLSNCNPEIASGYKLQLVATVHYILPPTQLKVLLTLVRLRLIALLRMLFECSESPALSYVSIFNAGQLPFQQLNSLVLSEYDGP